jgi:predicted porin
MKKHLIAAAVAAAVAVPAMAQNVEVYGILDMGYGVNKTSGDVMAVDKTKINGWAGLSGNRLGFRGTEDLGGGLKAAFVLETSVAPDAAFGAANRLTNITLSGGFGGVTVGRQVTPSKAMNDTFTAFQGGGNFQTGSTVHTATGMVTSDQTTTATLGTTSIGAFSGRTSNAVIYSSPTMNGFKVALGVIRDTSDNDALLDQSETSATAARIDYAAGPLAVAYARTNGKIKTEGTATVDGTDRKVTIDNLGGSYTLGATKIFVAHARAKDDLSGGDELKTKGTDVGVTYTMGAVTLLGSVGRGELGTDADVDGYQAQVHYAMSKRTTLYALYGNTKIEGKDDLGANVEHKETISMVGVRHSF